MPERKRPSSGRPRSRNGGRPKAAKRGGASTPENGGLRALREVRNFSLMQPPAPAKRGPRDVDDRDLELTDLHVEELEEAQAVRVPQRTAVIQQPSFSTQLKFGFNAFWQQVKLLTKPGTITGGASAVPLLVLFSINIFDGLDAGAFGLLLPEIRDWFGISLQTVTTLLAIVAFFGLVFALPLGFAADRLNRVRLMVTPGTAIWGVFSFFTAFAPSVGWMGAIRFGSGIGKTLAGVHTSLLSDYYPPHVRAGVFAFHSLANNVAQLLGPLMTGLLATWLFWQAPFLLYSLPAFVLAVIAYLRLREPVRGEQERRAMGASEAVAMTAERPPSWSESWRITMGVRSLRRIFFALPFLVGSQVVIGPLLSLYLFEVWGLTPAQRGVLATIDEPFQIAGIIVGGIIGNRFLRYRPGRLLTYIGGMAITGAGTIALIAVAPILPMVIVLTATRAFISAIFLPGTSALMAMVIPPRARAFALQAGVVFALPGLLIAPFAGGIGDAFGLRIGILVMVPMYLVGAFILSSAGVSVEADIRAATAASMAGHESRSSKEAGRAKMLVCRDVDVHYDDIQVLFNVDFDVEEGELVALLGTNGAGKSTLLRAISGLTAASNGAIFFDGEDITRLPAAEHAARGIIFMPGGRSLFPSLTVEENLRLAAWMYRREEDYVRDATERVLGFFPILRERYGEEAGNLSGGEQQMLGLAQAFLSRPRLLMIDELSLGLAPTIVDQLLTIVRAIHDQGTTIILVEQSVNVALTVARRAVFMEKGEVRFSGPTAELLRRTDILRSVYLKGSGAVTGSVSQTGSKKAKQDPAAQKDTVFEVRDLTKRFGGVTAVNGVSFTLEEGQILGVIGPNGAGKTTVFDMISGFTPADAGRIVLLGEDITELTPDQRAKAGLQRSFQDARLFPALTVKENIAVALERHVEARSAAMAALRLPNIRRSERMVARRAERLIDLLNLGDFRDKFVRELSTGSRRIVDLACVMAADPKVLLLDEPSSGIAQAETEELGPLLLRVKFETGCSLLVIEHDMPLIRSIADELIALDLGQVVTRGLPDDVLEHPRVVESYLGTDEDVIMRSGST